MKDRIVTKSRVREMVLSWWIFVLYVSFPAAQVTPRSYFSLRIASIWNWRRWEASDVSK